MHYISFQVVFFLGGRGGGGGRVQEINLAQASQYNAVDEHDHLVVKFKFCLPFKKNR